MQVYETFLNKI